MKKCCDNCIKFNEFLKDSGGYCKKDKVYIDRDIAERMYCDEYEEIEDKK